MATALREGSGSVDLVTAALLAALAGFFSAAGLATFLLAGAFASLVAAFFATGAAVLLAALVAVFAAFLAGLGLSDFSFMAFAHITRSNFRANMNFTHQYR